MVESEGVVEWVDPGRECSGGVDVLWQGRLVNLGSLSLHFLLHVLHVRDLSVLRLVFRKGGLVRAI